MIMVSLENAIASTGGFCCGRSYVVGHQRLSGLGYCFSASLPPLLASAASEALRIMSAEPSRFQRLQQNASIMHCGLIEACQGTHFRVQGIELSPIQHIVYGDPNLEKESENETYNILRESKLDVLVEELFDLHSIVVTRARYLVHEEAFRPEPSVKIMCNSEMTLDEVRNALDAIKQAIHKIT
ncbi:aminotransferase class I and II domain-containing protein [Ditylenchus destructor]|nr:aminotransferase class I and II domain-containing protein [Ditylenchus destructor]